MTSRHIANIVLRLLGAVWFVSGLLYLPQLLTISQMPDNPEAGRRFVISSALGGLASVVIGAILYVRSETVSAKLFPSEHQLSISATPDELRLVGFHLLGVYFAVGALSRLVGLIYLTFSGDTGIDESRLEYAWNTNREGLVVALIELLAGVGLFFGARGLAEIARRSARFVRSTPMPPEGPPDSE